MWKCVHLWQLYWTMGSFLWCVENLYAWENFGVAQYSSSQRRLGFSRRSWLPRRRRREEMAGGGGGGAAPAPKQEELQPHPVKDQLPNVSYCITSPPPWREFFHIFLAAKTVYITCPRFIKLGLQVAKCIEIGFPQIILLVIFSQVLLKCLLTFLDAFVLHILI
ncbi:hypothetical protein GW17_00012709 [Ensete ventricosum]|nr:hypothetical protein GW17_00012709 [Ensete ventricosum]